MHTVFIFPIAIVFKWNIVSLRGSIAVVLLDDFYANLIAY